MEAIGCSYGFLKFMSAWGQAEAGKGAMNCTLSSSITLSTALNCTVWTARLTHPSIQGALSPFI